MVDIITDTMTDDISKEKMRKHKKNEDEIVKKIIL